MPGRMQFGFNFGQPKSAARQSPSDDMPFRVLVLGEFGGQGQRRGTEGSSIGSRVRHMVDLDNFDEVMARICPCVALPPPASGTSFSRLEFRNLDDFTPDRLCRDVPDLAALQQTRRQLEDPVTFSRAAAMMRIETPVVDRAAPLSGSGSGASETDATTLERLLGSHREEDRATAPKSKVEQWMRQVVAPHVVPDAPKFQQQYLAAIDEEIDERLRGILHYPAFQALESAWRGLHRLVLAQGADERVPLHIMDVSRSELVADLLGEDEDREASGLRKCLLEAPTDGIEDCRWSLIVGVYAFSSSDEDAAILDAIARIAAEAGAPFIGEAEPSVFGCPSLPDATDPAMWTIIDPASRPRWSQLRRSTPAAWIGLAAPRFMLRLPYGAKTEPTDRPAFEEYTSTSGHADYLWGSPALLVAELLAQSFLEFGWDMEPEAGLELGDLPVHIVERDGEKRMHACAEAYLSERAGERMLECGVMPFMSYRNRNAIRVLRLQSIASPGRALAGPWESA